MMFVHAPQNYSSARCSIHKPGQWDGHNSSIEMSYVEVESYQEAIELIKRAAKEFSH
jgi:hypothetical protein